jgi:hypothetical protein
VKRRAVLIVAGTALVAPRALRAQQPSAKPFSIGMLLVTNRAQLASAGNLLPFERALRELGYIEDKISRSSGAARKAAWSACQCLRRSSSPSRWT